jgi:poly-gamma-glutamate capsule biosynthesis protein CapA/YwtB (metallophosphatase superfamily)
VSAAVGSCRLPVTLGAPLPSVAAPSARALALLLAVLAPLGCSGGSALVVAPIPAPSAGEPSTTPAVVPPARGRTTSPGRPVTIAFGGDVHFEGASRQALSGGLAAITPLLAGADLAMVNLETAITTAGTPAGDKQYVFRAPPSAFNALARAGVDVVTMANNHGMDYGVPGLRDSLAAATAARFPVVGIGIDRDAALAAHIFRVRGQRVAFLGATQVLDSDLAAAWTAGTNKPGLASAKEEERLVQAVHEARTKADTVVVDLHWGQEQSSCPLARQQSLAQRLVDAGADVVVGSHAHVLLGGGYLGRAYVDYGLGNFVFYARSGPGSQSGVLSVTVQGRSVLRTTWSPAVIRAGVPHPLTGSAATAARAAWERLRACTGLSAERTGPVPAS